jgi:fumarate hydratase class II
VDGLVPNRERIEALSEQSLSLVTPLAPHIGYDKAAELAKKAHATGKTARQVANEMGLLTPEMEAKVFDLRKLTEPGIPG